MRRFLSARFMLAITLGLFWLTTLFSYIGYKWLDPKLPFSIITEIQSYPTYTTAINIGIVALSTLAIGSILLFLQKNSGRWLFLAGIILILVHDYLCGPQVRNFYYGFFADISYALLGVIVALLWSDPIKQLFSIHPFTLAKVSYLRIFCLLILTTFSFLAWYDFHYPLSPALQHMQSLSDFSSIYGVILGLLWLGLFLFSPIGLSCGWNIARYTFVLVVLIDVTCGSYPDTQNSGMGYDSDRLRIMFEALTAALIFSEPLKAQFSKLKSAKNNAESLQIN